MRVAFVIDTIEPFYFGGYERRAFELARRVARDHEVTIMTSCPRDQVIEGMRYLSVRPHVSTFDANGYRSVKEAFRFALAVAKRSLGRHRFDIVDCNATPFIHVPSAWLLARHSGAKLILTVHEGLLEELAPYFAERGTHVGQFGLGALRLGYRSLHSLPDCVLACSEHTARTLVDEGISPSAVTHGGVAWFGEPRAEYSGRLVCIARLVPPKRVSTVIRGFAIAHSRGDASHLTIVGEGPDQSRLERLMSELDVRTCVQIRSGMAEQEKQDFLVKESGLCLSASLREGLSIATLECLGAGMPAVISSRPDHSVNGALDYIVDGENGIVTDGEAISLAEAIGRVARDGSLYARLSQGAFETAGRHTWDAAAIELQATYRRILDIEGMEMTSL